MKLQFVALVDVALFVCQVATRADQAADDRTNAIKDLQGEWQLESIEINGQVKIADEIMKRIRWKVSGQKALTIKPNSDGSTVEESATLALDPNKSPKHLDLTPLQGDGKGKAIKCIYSIRGDKLRIAFPGKDGQRPEKFGFELIPHSGEFSEIRLVFE